MSHLNSLTFFVADLMDDLVDSLRRSALPFDTLRPAHLRINAAAQLARRTE
jgi:hypothetical protein